MVDREAFPADEWGGEDQRTTSVLKGFWRSSENKILIARKSQTKSIVGYSCYIKDMGSMKGECYLMRIAVRSKCQRQGIGRKMMSYLLEKYPNSLSLDVNEENYKAINFYNGLGLLQCEIYKVMNM